MTVEAMLEPRFALTLSAASGLVLRDGVAYVIGDDRGALDRFASADGVALDPIPLLPGGADAVVAKADKPDLEALVEWTDGSLLALGSGSRPNRERAFRVDRSGAVEAIDLSPLYAALRRDIPDLNIEGTARVGTALVLAHRGVGRGDPSRLLTLEVDALLKRRASAWPADALRDSRPVDLGALDGVTLGFTDLATGPDGALHFLAAAEDTDDPYLDGACKGSVIGRIEDDGTARVLARLRPDVKAEGLAWDAMTQAWAIVTDADDPSLRAKLYALQPPLA